jgi:hypothetical protein
VEATSTLGSRILDPVDRHLGDPIAPPLRRQEKLRVEEPLITSEHGPTMQVVLWSVVHTPGRGRKVPLGFAFTSGRASQVQLPPLHHHATSEVAHSQVVLSLLSKISKPLKTGC